MSTEHYNDSWSAHAEAAAVLHAPSVRPPLPPDFDPTLGWSDDMLDYLSDYLADYRAQSLQFFAAVLNLCRAGDTPTLRSCGLNWCILAKLAELSPELAAIPWREVPAALNVGVERLFKAKERVETYLATHPLRSTLSPRPRITRATIAYVERDYRVIFRRVGTRHSGGTGYPIAAHLAAHPLYRKTVAAVLGGGRSLRAPRVTATTADGSPLPTHPLDSALHLSRLVEAKLS